MQLCGPTAAVTNGWLNCSLIVDIGTWLLPHGIAIRTRLYNGQAPGPPILVAPGTRVRIRLVNALGPNVPTANDESWTGFQAANSTNLHIHGIYDDAVHDDTFVAIAPGQERLYSYDVHESAGSSLLWYHPHHDGSSNMQAIGGMAGAFVISDALQEASLGLGAPTRLLLQSLHFEADSKDEVSTVLANGGASTLPVDVSNPARFNGTMLLVNGAEAPSQSLGVGSWLRVQLINGMVDGTNGVVLGFDAPSAHACTMRALAFDGVWLHAARTLPSVMLTSGARIELAISCSEPGTHTFGSVGSSTFAGAIGGGLPILTLHTQPQQGSRLATGGPITLPGPPPFYRDLSSTAVDGTFAIEFSSVSGANVVNGEPYGMRASYDMPLGAVQEWTVTGGEGLGLTKLHPYHQHMTHFQVASVSVPAAAAALGLRVGDWRDSVPLYRDLNYTVRFRAPFVGLMMVHCHTLKHAEMGMMTLANIHPNTPPTTTTTAHALGTHPTIGLVTSLAGVHAGMQDGGASGLSVGTASLMMLAVVLVGVGAMTLARRWPRRQWHGREMDAADEFACCEYQPFGGRYAHTPQ